MEPNFYIRHRLGGGSLINYDKIVCEAPGCGKRNVPGLEMVTPSKFCYSCESEENFVAVCMGCIRDMHEKFCERNGISEWEDD